MRTLERNKQTFYYALNLGKEEIIKDGFHTAEYITRYSAWTEIKANISAARGESEAELFGTDAQYDRVFVVSDMNCPIDENTVLAIDIAPNVRETPDVMPVFDYVVTRKAKSLNAISYAVAKVKTNG